MYVCHHYGCFENKTNLSAFIFAFLIVKGKIPLVFLLILIPICCYCCFIRCFKENEQND